MAEELMPKSELLGHMKALKEEVVVDVVDDLRKSFRTPSASERYGMWIGLIVTISSGLIAWGAAALQISVNTKDIDIHREQLNQISRMQNEDKGKTEEALRWIGQSLNEIKQSLKDRK